MGCQNSVIQGNFRCFKQWFSQTIGPNELNWQRQEQKLKIQLHIEAWTLKKQNQEHGCITNQLKEWRKPYLKPSSKLLVEKKPRELSSARPLQELHKDLPEGTLNFISSLLELLVPNKMGLVVVSLELLQQGFKLSLVEVLVDLSVEKGLHLIKVGGVEPGCEEGLLDCCFGCFLWGPLACAGLWSCRHADSEHLGVWCSWVWGRCAELGDGFHKCHLCCHHFSPHCNGQWQQW